MLRAYREKEEIGQVHIAELIRLQTFELMNIQLDEKSRLKNPIELWQFPWDETSKPILVDAENAINQAKNLAKLLTK